MLDNRAHEGLQPLSNPKERKGLKEVQSTAQQHSATHLSPLELAGQTPSHSRVPRRDPRQRPASPPRSRVANLPSSKQIGSASLEATPRRMGQTAIRSPACRTEALNAHDSAAAPGSDGVRPPHRTAAVTKVPSANSSHCSVIPGPVATLWEPAMPCTDVPGTVAATVLPTSCTFLCYRTLDRYGRDPRTRPMP